MVCSPPRRAAAMRAAPMSMSIWSARRGSRSRSNSGVICGAGGLRRRCGRTAWRRRNCGGSTSGSRNPLPGRRSRDRLAVRVRDGGGFLGRMSPRGRCQPQPISLPDSAL